MDKIKFYKTRIYGKLVAKFASQKQEQLFYELTGRKTLKPKDLTLMNSLTGIEFEEITETAANQLAE
jgi:hypothetical protein